MKRDITAQKKELKALGRTDATTGPAFVGRYVKDALVFSNEEIRFSWRQYRFANIYRKTLDLETACLEAGMSRESALRFLKRPDVVRWMGDREKMQQVKRAWNAEGRWWSEGDRMFQSEEVPKHRLEIWREFGERLEVKPGRGENSDLTGNKIHISIAPESLAAFREREKAVEAEIVNTNSGDRGDTEPRQE